MSFDVFCSRRESEFSRLQNADRARGGRAAVDSRIGSIILYSRSNDVVELLLGQGLDMNARDKDGSTLLVVSAAAYASGDPHSFAARAAAGSGVPRFFA